MKRLRSSRGFPALGLVLLGSACVDQQNPVAPPDGLLLTPQLPFQVAPGGPHPNRMDLARAC